MMKFRPQPGPQAEFLSTHADIAIYGGGAGSGKSFALLLEPLYYIGVPGFQAVGFRRTVPEIRNPGGLWDESKKIYYGVGGTPQQSPMHQWNFPSGARVSFAHLENDQAVMNWHGSQIALILYDELTTFSETQFWYLLSRNRTTCGVAPRIRATTNPDADSWVARFLDWWIGDDGYPIEERSGVLRWFIRLGDSIKWGDSRKELLKYKDPDGNPIPPKSMTFIPAKLTDNQILMKQDPTYIANLMALSTIDRERLLLGNWKIRPASGDFFRRQWVGAPVEILPSFKDTLRKVRGWDLGATEAREGRDPDWTCGTLIGEEQGQKKYYVLDHKFDRLSPDGVERLILETAKLDGRQTRIEIPQDPAQAGKAQKLSLLKLLAGYDVRFRPASGDKITRFKGFSAQAEGGNVTVALGDWNERWFRELENFPPKHGHDDDADATAQAFNGLLRALPRPVTGFYSGFH